LGRGGCVFSRLQGWGPSVRVPDRPLTVAALIEGLFRLKALEFAERFLVRAVGGVDATLEAHEGFVVDLKGVAEGRVVIQLVGAVHSPIPDLGVGLRQAAELPVIADQAIDIMALLWRSRMEALEVFGSERFQISGIFAVDDNRLRVDAGFQGILGRRGLAVSGARSRAFPSVEAIGLDLFE
jgi:hypothetical protein